ncbi:MAG: pyrroloquinoline quinone biosynthesis peptide chaperone PqqD [Gammaproteobacteria bacterium]|nr:pyrroloquinoline quinone biosynthesis peptide chaperone PqqD [Gammaproteobacteria bacterium]MDH3560898.1 pyrroloquinoline quinone biosynthesis peptide chaperone PqqD [Gammaproteobacteria bacterium]
MTEPISEDSRIRIAAQFRLQWEDSQQAYVLLYPEGMVKLNSSAGEILRRCEGSRTVSDIITDLKQDYPDADLKDDVMNLLSTARDNGWICAD